MIAAIDDPLASASGQFPLGPPAGMPPSEDVPSPVGLRPWGLRNLVSAQRPLSNLKSAALARYDHDQQVAVNAEGVPVITMGPPTANTTSSTDGEDPPSAEDWNNDFHPDEPLRT